MSTQPNERLELEVADAPVLEELAFRGFRGEADYQNMLDIINAGKEADDVKRSDTLETIAKGYAHLENCDPYQDMLFAEVKGEAIAYSRGWWGQEPDGTHVYDHFVFMKPDWRAKGIGTAMSLWMQDRLAQVAADHPAEAPKFFQMWANTKEQWYAEMIESMGFDLVRYGIGMDRPCSEPVEITPMPAGIVVRPAENEAEYRKVWEADMEAFRDHWGFSEPTEERYKNYKAWDGFQPDLWMIAWDGDQPVAGVQNFISKVENEEYGYQRGYTEGIFTVRAWRRQGLARGLLTRSIKMFQDMGMDHTHLGVDTENPNGALQLYTSVGYVEVERSMIYRKPLK